MVMTVKQKLWWSELLTRHEDNWQVPIKNEDKNETTLTSHIGTYCYLRLIFCTQNALSLLQRALNIILFKDWWKRCLVLINDVVIFSKNNCQHVKNIIDVLRLLYQATMTLGIRHLQSFRKNQNKWAIYSCLVDVPLLFKTSMQSKSLP